MAPVNKLKTYGRSSKSLVNSSVEAINMIFRRNKMQMKKKRRKEKLHIKELPARMGEALLNDDSFQVSMEDTFDKIVKGTAYNKVNMRTQISIVNSDSDASKSVKQVNSFYSPIMTRRRKKTASLAMSLSKSQDNKSNAIPHFKEPTVEKIDFSLEVEKVPDVSKSVSYIKVPSPKEPQRGDLGTSKGETSFEPFFTRTFREKQMIHSSTPLIPMRGKDKIVNYTISPIRNMTVEKNMMDSDISMPKNSSTPIVPRRSVRKSSRLPSDGRLQPELSEILSINHKSIDQDLHSDNNKFSVSEVLDAKKKLSNSYITLRKRKVLKNLAQVSKSSKKSKNKTPNQFSKSANLDISEELISGDSFVTSLTQFNTFEEKINEISTNAHKSPGNTHNLSDFESFEARNKDLLTSSVFTCKKNTPSNFITKRRRRLTDSCLTSVEKPKILKKSPKRLARRFSLQEHAPVNGNEILFKEVVVFLPQIDFALLVDNKSLNKDVEVNDVNNPISVDSSYVVQSYLNSHLELKRLVVNLTRLSSGLRPCSVTSERISCNQTSSIAEQSKSLFRNSYANGDQSVNKTKGNNKELRHSKSLSQGKFLNETGNSFQDYTCSSESSENDRNLTRKESGRFNHSSDEFEKYYTSVSAEVTCHEDSFAPVINPSINNDTSKLIIISNDVKVDKVNDSETFPNEIKQSNSLETNCDDSYQVATEGNSDDAVTNHAEFEADKFEEFFEQEVKTYVSDLNMPSNREIGEDDFEQFFVNVSKRSKSLRGGSKSTEVTVVNGDETRPLEIRNHKERIVNVSKFPWQTNGNDNAPGVFDSSVIDLTDLPEDEKPLICSTNSLGEQSSDIIEDSVLEGSEVDPNGFKIPSSSKFKRRQSKTMLLKGGKLWRRSLSMFRRNSIMLDVINEEACRVSANGCYCNCTKCRLARSSRRISNRRFSIRIVPATPVINPRRKISMLQNYAHNHSYVSDEILEDNLENSIRSLSLNKRKTSIIQNSTPVTARELVLRRCGQTEALPFEECYPKSVLQNCQKIGEGVYGEVFLFKNPNGGTSVMKVIPIEGDLIVNGERQKKFEEILSEITIALELSNLRNNKQNKTSIFTEVQKVQCVRGAYPEKLVYLWDLYDETRGSENESPDVFGEDQLYIVLQLVNGGKDLEAFIFNNAVQAYTMFQQVACALAVAEEELGFEHRDLHWGNILLTATDKNSKVTFRLDGNNYDIMTKGVEVAIIDFTLSRIEYDGVVIFNDLSLDPDLFTAEGDYQFEIYKLMQKKNGNNWQRFEPYSNVLWLHYTLDKAITALRYKNPQTKIHKEYLGKLKQLKNSLLEYNSAKEFVRNNF